MKTIKETLGLLHSMVLSGERTDGTATKMFRQSFKELENITNVLVLAKEALEDLGACNDPECQETGCSHVLIKIKELLEEGTSTLLVKERK